VNKDNDLTEDENSASFCFHFLAISSIINKNAILLSSTTQFHVKRSRRLTFSHFEKVVDSRYFFNNFIQILMLVYY